MNNILQKNGMTSEQLAMVQTEFDQKQKNKGLAFLLWFFTGGIGGHRYYLGDIGYAIGMTCTLGGLGVWTLIDLFLISGRVEKVNQKAELEAIQKVKAYTAAE